MRGNYEDRHPQDRNEPSFVTYQAILKRVEQLMDAKLGTPDGTELAILSTAAQFYEGRFYPEISTALLHEDSK